DAEVAAGVCAPTAGRILEDARVVERRVRGIEIVVLPHGAELAGSGARRSAGRGIEVRVERAGSAQRSVGHSRRDVHALLARRAGGLAAAHRIEDRVAGVFLRPDDGEATRIAV